jgi:hypothetical protein
MLKVSCPGVDAKVIWSDSHIILLPNAVFLPFKPPKFARRPLFFLMSNYYLINLLSKFTNVLCLIECYLLPYMFGCDRIRLSIPINAPSI